MGKMNLLKANWIGKVGQTVGAKWKNRSTIRSFTPPSNPRTPAQVAVRSAFRDISSFVALFALQMLGLSALNTRGMSIRNAIISLNKDMIQNNNFDPADLLVSRGGLPSPNTFVPIRTAGGAGLSATWTPLVGASISEKARVVMVAVDQSNNFAVVGSALNSAGTLTISVPTPTTGEIEVYAYTLDFRGSARVASPSIHAQLS